MNCVLCGRRSDGEHCSLHQRAFESIIQSYEYWRNATSIGWKEYLREIEKNSNSGMWVIEVSAHLLSKNEEVKDK